jgi:hypothetical protein
LITFLVIGFFFWKSRIFLKNHEVKNRKEEIIKNKNKKEEIQIFL